MWELDHIFAMTAPGGGDAATLEAAGFVFGLQRDHPGQGTANHCFMFRNAYLELIYATGDEAIRSPTVLRTGLWERARWRDSGASPFGVCLRGRGEPPVPTWPYYAKYLPAGQSIPIAGDELRAPLLFFLRHDGRAAAPPMNPQAITRVRLESPRRPSWCDAIARIEPAIEVVEAPRHAMAVDFDGAACGRNLDLPGSVPWTLRW